LYRMHPAATPGLVRLDNYINLLILVPGFVLVYIGTKKMMPLIKKPSFAPTQLLVFGYIIFAALYALIVLHDPARHVSMTTGSNASYYEPDWLIVFTIIIPRLLLWFMGALAVYNIYAYAKNVSGTLYRSALIKLALGLGTVVLMTIVIRCLESVSTTLNAFKLGSILVVIFILLLLLGAGYVLIAQGASRLKKLEEL